MNFTQSLTIILTFSVASAKIYDRCELAKELRHVYDFPEDEISTWLCIVQHESHFNTSAMNHGSGDHGLFQISQLYWCATKGTGYACNTNCASFRDDDIKDDVYCVKKIFKEHSRLSGNGFNAWTIYGYFCKGDTSKYIEDCPDNSIENTIKTTTEVIEELDEDGYHFPPLPSPPKVYNRCELAKELKDVHQIPVDEIPTWVCIAQHESSFNTSANNPVSGDHGLFQISEQYWCSIYIRGGGCNAKCSSFRNSDISDDVRCARTIFNEHKAISGDGFTAWSIYPQYCKGDTSKYIGGCPDANTTIKPKKKSKKITAQYTERVYKRCELAKELKYIHNLPENQISTLICIAKHESNFNTSASNPGSGDHGIFQISEKYWCSPYGRGSGCNVHCDSLRDTDITDDLKCVEIIYNEHLGISGDGWNAWAVYPIFCKGDTSSYIRECFDTVENCGAYDIRAQDKYDQSISRLNYIKSSFNLLPSTQKSFEYPPSSSQTFGKANDYSFASFTSRFNPLDMHQAASQDLSYQNRVGTKSIAVNASFRSSGAKSRSLDSPIQYKSIMRPPGPKRRPGDAPKPPRFPGKFPTDSLDPTRPLGPPRRPESPPRPPRPPTGRPPTGRPPTIRPPTGRPRPPRPPPPPPTTPRPFNWNNLPGIIFTLWPSSTTGPVFTSVYSTTAKSSLGVQTTVSTTSRPSSDRETTVKSDIGKIKTLNDKRVSFGAFSDSHGSTVKREEKDVRNNYPGYSFSRSKLGFSLVQAL